MCPSAIENKWGLVWNDSPQRIRNRQVIGSSVGTSSLAPEFWTYSVPAHLRRRLERTVTNPKTDPYLVDHATWLKIRNGKYSPWAGREELFERERGSDPGRVWDECLSESARIAYTE
ncbi:MAG TPA: hypothetical protein VGV15_01125 [Terriglobales bacterium]|nr:hypothetical protein [Terriglobales bacterium]